MTTIDDVETKIRAAKQDTRDPLARIVNVTVGKRMLFSQAPDGPERDMGVALVIERASGASGTLWFEVPDTWEPHHDLVAILSYFHIDPDDDEDSIRDLKGQHIPLRHHEDIGWDIDWGIIEDADLPEPRFR